MSTGEQPLHHSGYPVEPPHGARRALDTPFPSGDNGFFYGGPWRLQEWDGHEWLEVATTESEEEQRAFVVSGPYWPPPPPHLRRGGGVYYTE